MTMGVMGIRLRGEDEVIGMEVVEENGTLLVLSERGQGKRTVMSEYIPKNRGTLGVTTFAHLELENIGPLAEACMVQEEDEITLISQGGIVMRTKVAPISIQGRATQGVRVMELDEGDTLAALARIDARESFPHRDGSAEEGTQTDPSEPDEESPKTDEDIELIIIDEDGSDESDLLDTEEIFDDDFHEEA
jgi:DNA gyrase subunit A